MTIRGTFLPQLEAARSSLFDAAAADGTQLELADFGGFRTQADTTQILEYRTQDYAVYSAEELAAGRTPVPIATWRPIAPYGQSWHDYGAAFDADVISFDESKYASADDALAAVGALASQYGLKWGGAGGKTDTPHFQLDVPLATARAMWEELQGSSSSSSTAAVAFLLAAAGAAAVWVIRQRWFLA